MGVGTLTHRRGFIVLSFQIPEVVYKMTSLTTLFLRFNRVKVVGDEIKGLTVSRRERGMFFLRIIN